MAKVKAGDITRDTHGNVSITGTGIPAFRALQILGGLALEINTGMKLSRLGSVSNVAREAMGSTTRDKIKLLIEFKAWYEREFDTECTMSSVDRAIASKTKGGKA